jgi:4-alpha-glucanotransferase
MHRVVHERNLDRAALLQALDSVGLKPEGADASPASFTEALAHAVHVYLAHTAASLAVVQVEDLVGMADPVNVPGTNHEHANWQRKMTCSIDEMFSRDAVQRVLQAVHAARAG